MNNGNQLFFISPLKNISYIMVYYNWEKITKSYPSYHYIYIYIYAIILNKQEVTYGELLAGWGSVLILEFPIHSNGCHSKVKKLSLPYHLHIMGERILGCISFPNVYRYVKCKQPPPGFELGSLCLFPSTRAVTLWAPLYVMSLNKVNKDVNFAFWTLKCL